MGNLIGNSVVCPNLAPRQLTLQWLSWECHVELSCTLLTFIMYICITVGYSMLTTLTHMWGGTHIIIKHISIKPLSFVLFTNNTIPGTCSISDWVLSWVVGVCLSLPQGTSLEVKFHLGLIYNVCIHYTGTYMDYSSCFCDLRNKTRYCCISHGIYMSCTLHMNIMLCYMLQFLKASQLFTDLYHLKCTCTNWVLRYVQTEC